MRHKFLLILLLVMWPGSTRAQFPGLANQIFGPDSYLRGIRNVMGGVLAADKVHNKCMQKTICDEFSDEVVKMTEEVDPVKRTIVMVPKVVQRRGRLRWIGDAVVNGVSAVVNKLGLNPYRRRAFRRRQGVLVPTGGETLAAQAFTWLGQNWDKIPIQQIAKVVDFGMDLTGGMERKGNVYPYAKSMGMGYAYGHRRDDDFGGVCEQIAPDCGGWWDHLETVNNYEGGAISRNAAKERGTLSRAGLVDNNDPLTWNHMKPEHIMQPRVFLCKSGLFLEKINDKMGGDGVTKERFGPEDFQESCDPQHLDRHLPEAADTVAAATEATGGGGGGATETAAPVPLEDIEIIDARDQESTPPPIFGDDDWTEGFDELPILVFEGLPSPGVDQSEEELVESVLRLVSIPQTAVRTAVRLPLLSRGKSIVLVEMDSTEDRDSVIDHKGDLRHFRSPLVQVGIRRARYRELWRYVRSMTVAKEVLEGGTGQPGELVPATDDNQVGSIDDILETEDDEEEEEEEDKENEEEEEDEEQELEELPPEEEIPETDFGLDPPPGHWQSDEEDEVELIEAHKKKKKKNKKNKNKDKSGSKTSGDDVVVDEDENRSNRKSKLFNYFDRKK